MVNPGLDLTRTARASIFLFALTLSTLLLGGGGLKFSFRDRGNDLVGAEKKFRSFMQSYEKNYSTRAEYLHRLRIFADNLIRVAEHQALDPTAVHGVTPFSDLSQEEFEQLYTGLKGGRQFGINGVSDEGRTGGEAPPLDVEGLPENFDWREKGAVTEVKMQVKQQFNYPYYLFAFEMCKEV